MYLNLFAAIGVLLMVISCTNSTEGKFTVTKSGLGYKIFSGKGKDSLKPGNIIRYRITQTIEDSLLNTPEETPEQFIGVPEVRPEFDLMEIANKIAVGDSVIYRFSVDTLLAKNPAQEPPAFMKKGKNIYVYMKVLKKYDSSQTQLAMEDRQKEYTRLQQVIEQKRQMEFDKIAKEKFGNALQTPGGTLVKITKEGDGPKCDSGKIITMRYEGRLTNGKVFDGNLTTADSSKSKPPFEFQLGAMPIIRGWSEALPMLHKGAKASFLVPYQSAYGPGGYMGIPGFSHLLFDVEILDVKDAPKQTTPSIPPSSK